MNRPPFYQMYLTPSDPTAIDSSQIVDGVRVTAPVCFGVNVEDEDAIGDEIMKIVDYLIQHHPEQVEAPPSDDYEALNDYSLTLLQGVWGAIEHGPQAPTTPDTPGGLWVADTTLGRVRLRIVKFAR